MYSLSDLRNRRVTDEKGATRQEMRTVRRTLRNGQGYQASRNVRCKALICREIDSLSYSPTKKRRSGQEEALKGFGN